MKCREHPFQKPSAHTDYLLYRFRVAMPATGFRDGASHETGLHLMSLTYCLGDICFWDQIILVAVKLSLVKQFLKD